MFLCGWQFWPWSALHGFAQLLLTHTGWLPTLQSWPGSGKPFPTALSYGYIDNICRIWTSLLQLMCRSSANKRVSVISPFTHRWLQFAPLWMSVCSKLPPVCLKCWFCSRWMTATCTNSTFDSQRPRWHQTIQLAIPEILTFFKKAKRMHNIAHPISWVMMNDDYISSVWQTGDLLSNVGKKCSHCSRPGYHHYLHCKHFIAQWTIEEATQGWSSYFNSINFNTILTP